MIPAMRTFRFALIGAAALLLAGCGESVRYTYVKKAVPNEMVTIGDEARLKDTSGVVNAIVSAPDHNGMVTLSLFLDQDNKSPGMEQAMKLGYTRAPE